MTMRKIASMLRMSFGRRPTTMATRVRESRLKGAAYRRTYDPSVVSAETKDEMPNRACWTVSAMFEKLTLGPSRCTSAPSAL